MSSLSRPRIVEHPSRQKGVPVHPTIDLTQPGGPYPYGDAIIADGAGAWIIAPTLRPYLLSFSLTEPIEVGETLVCQHQGANVGFTTMLVTRLVGLSITTNEDLEPGSRFVAIVLIDGEAVGELGIEKGRKAWRRDLDHALPVGSTIEVAVMHAAGRGSSFDQTVVGVELEG